MRLMHYACVTTGKSFLRACTYVRIRHVAARLLYATKLTWLTFARKSGMATAVVAVAVPMPLNKCNSH